MAAEDEGRTEEPSEYKLEKARKEGRVAKSKEVSDALVLLFTVMVLIFIAKYIFNQIVEFIHFYFYQCGNPNPLSPSLYIAFLNYFLKCIIPILIIGIVAGIAGNIIQTRGFIFSWKPIQPDFQKIVPKIGEYLKKTIFSLKGIFNILKSIGKVIIIGVVGYIYVRKDMFVLIEIISNGDIAAAIGKIAMMSAQILITVAIIFLIISIPDFFVQKRDFMESMKMTKQEQKEEYKEMEGDPEVKARLKQMQQQLLKQNIPKAVAEADVVITNPTHYAVSLKYDNTVADSPMVTSKGVDETAQLIKRIARENDIPIVENRPVARDLYTNVEVGDIIPNTYWQTIAVIYSHLDKYKQN